MSIQESETDILKKQIQTSENERKKAEDERERLRKQLKQKQLQSISPQEFETKYTKKYTDHDNCNFLRQESKNHVKWYLGIMGATIAVILIVLVTFFTNNVHWISFLITLIISIVIIILMLIANWYTKRDYKYTSCERAGYTWDEL